MYDVIVAGYGPTGMMAALLLARAGHTVCVLERYNTLYNLPRVGIVHDDIQRMFQEVGCMEAVQSAMFFLPRYELANQGRVLMSTEVAPMATHGWPEFISVYQPAFETELDVLVRAEGNVTLLQGETVVGVSQDGGKVTVTTEGASGRRDFEGRYLIGADGGNSFVRQAVGIEYESLGFDQEWLVIDAKARRPQRAELPYLRQFCEPAQPGMTMRMGPDHRRWSFMILEDESRDEAMRHENVWRRLDRAEGGTPEEFELIRVASYKFQSLLASRWREGRVLLAGDSAHQMPPFLAQGLCSGFRDAHDLAWKLDLVLRGAASDGFLDTYEQERGPNARATIIESAQVGQNVIERDLERARLRDERLLALHSQMQASAAAKSLIAFRVPGFDAGFISRTAAGAGDAFGQARVRFRGVEGRFDDVVGRGFMILSRAGDAEAVLSPKDVAWWRALGGSFVQLGSGGVEDFEGYYTGVMDAYGCDVIVKRPDYYIFGACVLAGLPGLVQEMREQLLGS